MGEGAGHGETEKKTSDSRTFLLVLFNCDLRMKVCEYVNFERIRKILVTK